MKEKNIILEEKVEEAGKDNRPVLFCENGDWGYKEDVIKISVAPEVVLKREVGERIDDYWADTVIAHIDYKWFLIRKENNRIIIEPVTVEPIC